jgi:hypothetical protein
LADEYQIPWEYSDGNTISFKTNDLKITYHRRFMRVVTRKDGTRVVVDPNDTQYRVFSFSAVISGNTMDTLDGVMMGSITYSGAYPRITTLYWDGDSTETNIETAITSLATEDLGNGYWRVHITMEEKDQ